MPRTGSCGTAASRCGCRAFTAAQTIAAPAATWTALAPLTASQVRERCQGDLHLRCRPAERSHHRRCAVECGGPGEQPETVDIEALPGTNVSGSAITTAILFPRNVVGTQAPTIATPGMIFVWDRRTRRAAPRSWHRRCASSNEAPILGTQGPGSLTRGPFHSRSACCNT